MATREPELNTTMTYSSGTAKDLGSGWDVMTVVCRREDGEQNRFVIARDSGGNILHKTDFERWEVVSDEKDLRKYRYCFADRDKATAGRDANQPARETDQSSK